MYRRPLMGTLAALDWTAIIVAGMGLIGAIVPATITAVVLVKVRRMEPVVHDINRAVNTVPPGAATLRTVADTTGAAVDELVQQEKDRLSERDDT